MSIWEIRYIRYIRVVYECMGDKIYGRLDIWEIRYMGDKGDKEDKVDKIYNVISFFDRSLIGLIP